MKKISIVVPVYNSEAFLSSCINSILNQTYQNLELILVNDGSEDRSADVCESYTARDRRVKVIHQNNSGPSNARNIGIKNASGEYLMFVDSDDYIEPCMVEELVKIAECKNVDYVISGMYIDEYTKNGKVKVYKSAIKKRELHGENEIRLGALELFENEKINGPCCKLYKTEIIRKFDILMPVGIHLQEDLYFNLLYLEKIDSLVSTDQCWYHYAHRGDSLTSRYVSGKYEMLNTVHNKVIDYYSCLIATDKLIKGKIFFIYIKDVYSTVISLFNSDCKLNFSEKFAVIKRILNSSEFSIKVSNASQPGLKHKILIAILKSKNALIIFYLNKIFSFLKSKFSMKL